MTPEFLAELVLSWNDAVGCMPELEQEIARPASDDVFGELDRMVQAAAHDIHPLARGRRLADIHPSRKDELLGRFGWLIAALRDWKAADDPCDRRLYGALAAATVWDAEGNLWSALIPLVHSAASLVDAFDRILGSRQVVLTTLPHTPLWEREHLDKMLDADRREDWITLAEITSAFQLPTPDIGFAQAARALWAIDPPRLIAFASGRATWLEATNLLAALTPVDFCCLATESGVTRIRFAALDRIANRLRRDLSQDESEALRALLASMAEDEATWPVFIQAFNRYPVRYAIMQRPLGKALARASVAAILSYVDAIELTLDDESIHAVAACLSEFRGHASNELRSTLWTRAYTRWDQWSFGLADGRDLMEPAQCALDFAVIGWLLECAPENFARAEMARFGVQLRMIEAEWHGSVTTFRSTVNRLLSRYLLLAHSDSINAREVDWLASVQLSLPAEMTNEYARLRYGEHKSCYNLANL